MPLNLNIPPYYDDYSPDKHFYRILFRPGVAVQVRELTQIQSILQQQVKSFGDSVFQHGAMVIPGQIAFDARAAYVRLQSTITVNGNPVTIDLNSLNGQTIQGSATGLTALVVHVEAATNTDSPTLYVKYLDSGTSGNVSQFQNSEALTLKGSATTVALTEVSSACGSGASAQINKGVYYIYGFFVQVEKQYLVLSKYSSTVNARVGLQIVESIVTPEQDPSLNDNAQGANDYAAPGAHRYAVDLVLTQKTIGDTSSDADFVELLRLVNSVKQSIVQKTEYSRIAEELAARTADTNGDFTVRPFSIDVREHLDTSFLTSGTVVAATNAPNTITLAQTASANNTDYVNMTIYITDGPGAGSQRTILNYNGTTKVATVDSAWTANGIPTSASTYLIRNLAAVNRGIYPPPPFGTGDATKLAVGMESGRAYVDGYQIDTLSTTYVDVDKARDTNLTTNSVIPAPLGNYVYAKNLSNVPLPSGSVSKDFLKVSLSNKKGSSSFTQSTDEVGTARVRAINYVLGSGQAATNAIFQLFLFDIKMNAGVDINTVRSFHLTNVLGSNNNGDGLDAWGDVVSVFSLGNVNGTGLQQGATIAGPSGVGTEKVVFWDSLNNLLYTEAASSTSAQILTIGQGSVSLNPAGTAPTTATTFQVSSRTQLFDTADKLLIYPLPQQVVSSVTGSGGTSNTNYYVRRMFEGTRNSSGNYVFNVGSTEQFAPFSTADYLATVVTSTASATVGNVIDLSKAITNASYGGTPANTVLTFSIASGPGSTAGDVIKFMGTVIKTAVSAKTKTLTSTTLSLATPASSFSLGKADIYAIDKIVDSGNPATAADVTNASQLDITNRYSLDNGQRDAWYDVGNLTLRQGAPSPAGQIQVSFRYFQHSASGDYFSVDSYANQVPYPNIPTYYSSNGEFLNLRDCLDFRPRRADDGVNFSDAGSAFGEPVRPNDVVRADFQFYLGRIDKIVLDGKGNFNVVKGSSALSPVAPSNPKDGMLLYTLTINPYTLNTSDVKTLQAKNQGYTMAKIAQLENRIANLEYYTSLTLLEQNTASMQVTDATTGLDRYKAGFMVDNFKTFSVANVFDSDFKASLDQVQGQMRPMYVQNAVALLFDFTNSTGYVQKGAIIMLPYTEVMLAQQPYATEIENVNPFAIFAWLGDITLMPSTDAWKDTDQRPDVLQTDTSAMDNLKYGQYPLGTVWGDWQTSWVGVPTETATDISPNKAGTAPGASYGTEVAGTRTGAILYQDANGIHPWAAGDTWDEALGVSAQVSVTDLVTSTQQVGQVRTGITTSVVPQVAQKTVNDRVISIQYYPYMRSRRINIVGKHLKPLTRVYPFFDGIDVSAYCQPYSDATLTPSLKQSGWTQQTITWGGNITSGTNSNNGTVTQTVVDPASTGTFYAGNLNDPLYTDGIGNITLFFEIPDDDTLKFRTGSRTFMLSSSSTDDQGANTSGQANYTAQGVLETDQATITSLIEPKIVQTEVSQTRTLTDTTVFQQNKIIQGWVDPLAESFLIDESGGCFITKIDLFFATIDPNVPVTVQIRTMVNGYPGPQILPFAEKTLYPSSTAMSGFTNSYTQSGQPNVLANQTIQTSQDGSVATSFVFDTPVYVQDGTEYCLVVMANSTQYTCFIGRLGDTVLGSNSSVSAQPYAGVLFTSQNGSTWTADQTADLKFTIWRASFDPTKSATVYLNNADVDYAILGSLPFQTANGSNIVRVLHPNHGMPKGANVQSSVTISNVATGTYNGLTSAQLTGTFPIDNVDLDSYTITVTGTAATGTGRVGPDGVIATQNRQYDNLTPIVSTMVLQNTSINASIKTTSGKSPHNNSEATQSPYVIDASYTPITLGTETDFATPRMIASSINETNNLAGSKSLTLELNLSTSKENLSPMIDTSRMSVIAVNSLIDDPTFQNMTLQTHDVGTVVTSNATDTFTFATQAIFAITGLTGTSFAANDTVTGAASGATATVVSWDSVYLTVSGIVLGPGNTPFQVGEALDGPNAVGTIQNIQKVNTISNPSGNLDFSGFAPGRGVTITGVTGANLRPFSSPVTVLTVSAHSITVDAGTTDLAPASGVSGATLTQYNRFVSEVAPTGCSASARYITRSFTFATPATSLQVMFSVNRPPGSFVDVYYRIAGGSTAITSQLYTKMTLDSSVDSAESTNPAEFKDYSFTANSIGNFTSVMVKIVMRGGNSSQVPIIEEERIIALAT